jgi:hypothetical protein
MTGYVPNVPLSNQSLGQTQPTINTNFTVLNTAFGTDHVNYTSSALPTAGNSGRHNQVSLVQQATDSTISGSLAALYTKAAPTTASAADLYYEYNTNNVVQMTGGGVTAAAWCQFNGSIAGTNPPTAGYNVTNITRNSAGNYTVNFTRNFTNTIYASLITATGNFSGTSILINTRVPAALTFTVLNVISATDSGDISIVIFGKLK